MSQLVYVGGRAIDPTEMMDTVIIPEAVLGAMLKTLLDRIEDIPDEGWDNALRCFARALTRIAEDVEARKGGPETP